MNKEQVKNDIILPNLKEGEKLIGFFLAERFPSFKRIVLFGGLSGFFLRYYYVAVTNLGMHFHKLGFSNKPDTHDFFTWNEIENIKLSKFLWWAPLKLRFSDGEELNLKATIKARGDKIPKLDDRTKEFILSKVNLVH